MLTRLIAFAVFAATAAAQSVDPGWIKAHGAEYVANTGDTNYTPALVFAWDATNRLATPLKFDQPVQARFETPADDGHIYGLEVDADTGDLYPVQRESTRKTDAEYAAAKAAEKAKRTGRKTDRAALKTAIQAIDPAAFPAGAQRQTIKAIVDALKELRRIEAKE